jgi:transposase
VPRPRSAMRKIRDVLRLTYGEGLSRHQVSAATGVPQTTVVECLARARAAGVTWPLPDGMDDRALEGLLYRRAEVPPAKRRPTPAWADVHRELRRKGVTLQLLWMEEKGRSCRFCG